MRSTTGTVPVADRWSLRFHITHQDLVILSHTLFEIKSSDLFGPSEPLFIRLFHHRRPMNPTLRVTMDRECIGFSRASHGCFRY